MRNKSQHLLDNKDEIIYQYQQGLSANKLSKIYGIAPNNMVAFLRRHNVAIEDRTFRKYHLNFQEWPSTKEGCYWLGFLLADGYINPNKPDKLCVELGGQDLNHLEKLRDFICPQLPITIRRNNISPNHSCCRLYVCSTSIVTQLISLGWFGFKNGTNTDIMTFANERPDFIRGFFDGDGSIGRRELNIVSPHSTILEAIANTILENCGIALRVQRHKTNNKLARRRLYRIRTTKMSAIKTLYEWMYVGGICLDRKKAALKGRLNGYSRKPR